MNKIIKQYYVDPIELHNELKNYSFQASLAINVFTDGVIAIANLYDKRAKHFKRWCPRTTLVEEDDHKYIQKDCLSLPQTAKFKNIDGKWRQI